MTDVQVCTTPLGGAPTLHVSRGWTTATDKKGDTMTQEPTVTVLPWGVSGQPDGTPPAASRGHAVQSNRAAAVRANTRTPEQRERIAEAMRKSWAAKRKAKKGGAARATTGAGSKSARRARPPEPNAKADLHTFRIHNSKVNTAAPPAPGSLAAKPDRANRLRACIDELTIERDSLTVIIEHLVRLIS